MIRVEKAWGWEEIVSNSTQYCGKVLHVLPGKQCSLHYHILKDETFYLLDGDCEYQTELVPRRNKMVLGEPVHIPPGMLHRFASRGGCRLMEVSTEHSDADVVRLEPSGDFCS